MADLNPDTPTPPVVIDPNPVNAQIASFLRDIGIVVSFGTALLGFLSRKDLAGAYAFVQSEAAVPAIGLLVGFAIMGYRQWLTRRNRAVQVEAATTRPGTAVLVKGVHTDA